MDGGHGRNCQDLRANGQLELARRARPRPEGIPPAIFFGAGGARDEVDPKSAVADFWYESLSALIESDICLTFFWCIDFSENRFPPLDLTGLRPAFRGTTYRRSLRYASTTIAPISRLPPRCAKSTPSIACSQYMQPIGRDLQQFSFDITIEAAKDHHAHQEQQRAEERMADVVSSRLFASAIVSGYHARLHL